jgi:hypothetical protein
MNKKFIFLVMMVFGLAFFSCDNGNNGDKGTGGEYRIFKNQSSFTFQVIFVKFDNLSEYDASRKSFSLSPGQEKKVVYNSDFIFHTDQDRNVIAQGDGNTIIFTDR